MSFKSCYIIAYTYESTDDWIGAYPSEIYQWFIMEGKTPKAFYSRNDAELYCKTHALIRPCIIPIAGSETNYFTPTYHWMD